MVSLLLVRQTVFAKDCVLVSDVLHPEWQNTTQCSTQVCQEALEDCVHQEVLSPTEDPLLLIE